MLGQPVFKLIFALWGFNEGFVVGRGRATHRVEGLDISDMRLDCELEFGGERRGRVPTATRS